MKRPSVIPALPDRYVVESEIDRGGMGCVWRVNDLHFGRPMAIKVMLPETAAQPEAVARFQRESQITGVLQHPGIPPVVDRGKLEDTSPFFSMKLIEGQTLSSLLKQRENTAEDLPRFLGIFEQVCHAVGFAHSRGIIHRDLKPANIMVGEFGEVQVMDWGLARYISDEGKSPEMSSDLETVLDQRLTDPDLETAIFVEQDSGATGNTDEAGDSRTITVGGQVMGTLAYMPPEQARGNARLDARADVFALGGILCKILTGRAPYSGNDPMKVYQQVAIGDLQHIFSLLDESNVDAELVTLTRRCLSSNPEDRLSDAHRVGEVIREYEETTRKRLEQEKTERAAAEARTVEERKRRRVVLLASGLVIALLVAIGLGGWAILQQRAEANARRAQQQTEKTLREQQTRKDIQNALQQAVTLRDGFRFAAASTLLTQAENRLQDLPPKDALRKKLKQARKDLVIVTELDQIKQEKSNIQENQKINIEYGSGPQGAYAQAFQKYGLDIVNGAPGEIAGDIKSSPVARHLLDGLYAWHQWEKSDKLDEQLLNVIQATDVHDRKQLYLAIRTLTAAQVREQIDKLDTADLSPAFIHLLSSLLNGRKQFSNSLQLLRIASSQHPSDYWLHAAFLSRNLNLGQEESIGHCYAALAIRPNSKFVLHAFGVHLYEQKRYREAQQAFRRSLKSDPAQAHVHCNLVDMYMRQGQFDKAEQAAQRALELDASYGPAYSKWANYLSQMNRFAEAEKAYRKAIELETSDQNHLGLGEVLHLLGREEEAEQEFRKALSINPYTSQAYTHLATSLARRKQLTEAEKIARQGLKIETDRYARVDYQPEAALAHRTLGEVHEMADRHAEAIKEYRLAVQKDPGNWVFRKALVELLYRQRKLTDAEQACHDAIKFDPEMHVAHDLLGVILMKDKLRFEEAEKAFQAAIQLAPDTPEYLTRLGALYEINDQDENAEEQYRTASRVAPDSALGHIALGHLFLSMGKYRQAEEEYGIGVELEPGNNAVHVSLSEKLLSLGKYEDAERVLRTAIKFDPQEATLRHRLARLLVRMKKLEDARIELNFVVEIDSEYGEADLHHDLGEYLRTSGQYAAAVKEYQKAIQINPESAESLAYMGVAFEAERRLVEAEKAYQSAIEIEPDEPFQVFRLGSLYKRQGRLKEAESLVRSAIDLAPENGDYYASLGEIYYSQRNYVAAELQYQRAIELGSTYAIIYRKLGYALRRQNKYTAAKEALQAAVKFNPRDAFAYDSLGGVLHHLDMNVEAEEAYRKSLELNPNYGPAHNNLAMFFQHLGRKDEAEGAYRAACKVDPKAIVPRHNLANLLGAEGRYEEAIKLRQAILAVEPTSYRSLRHIGRINMKLERYASAEKAFQAALKIAPRVVLLYGDLVVLTACWQRTAETEQALKRFENFVSLTPATKPDAYTNLGKDLKEHQQYALADKVLRTAIKLMKENPDGQADLYDELGEMLLSNKEYDKAAKCYGEAMKLLPAEPQPRLKLAQTLKKQSQLEEALEHFQKALELAQDDAPLVKQINLEISEVEQDLKEVTNALPAVSKMPE